MPASKEAKNFIYLADLQNVALESGEGDALRSDIQIFRTGEFYDPRYGDFEITEDMLQNIVKNFKDGVKPQAPYELPVDYEHTSAKDGGPIEKPAAGWIKDLYLNGKDKLFAVIEWTGKAADMIKNGEYRYVSPEYNENWFHKEMKKYVGATLFAVGLTNRPFLEGMAAVTLSEGGVVSPTMELSEYQRFFFEDEISDEALVQLKETFGLEDSDYDVIKQLCGDFDYYQTSYSRIFNAMIELLYAWVEKLELEDEEGASAIEAQINQLKPMVQDEIMKYNSQFKISLKGGEENNMSDKKRKKLLEEYKKQLTADPNFKLDDDASDEEQEVLDEAREELEDNGEGEGEGQPEGNEGEGEGSGEEGEDDDDEDADDDEGEGEGTQLKDKGATVTLSETKLQELTEAAAAGLEAKRELTEMRVAKQVDQYILSETNPNGKVLPKGRESLTNLLSSLEGKQLENFQAFLNELPAIKEGKALFETIGSGDNNSLAGDKNNAKLADRAKALAEEKGISYKEALTLAVREK